MNKKILIIAGIFVLIIVVVVLFFIFKKPNPTTIDPTTGSPFGDAPGGSSQNNFPQIITGDSPLSIEDRNGLKKITSAPVSDGNFLPQASSSAPVVEFIERSTGHIFHADLDSGLVTRRSNTTFPKIQQIAWGIPGSLFIGQSINSGTIESNIFSISPNNREVSSNDFSLIDTTPLTPDIVSASFSPDGTSFFYLGKNRLGAEGLLANTKGEKLASLWQSATDEWTTEWKQKDTIAITNKASNNTSGVLLFLDVKTKKTKTILSGIPGLTTNTSPSGNKILYGTASGNSYQTYLYTIEKGSVDDALFTTLPEKCVWSHSETFIVCGQPMTMKAGLPDIWYQGKESFNDELWKLDLLTLELTRISPLNPSELEHIDVVNIKMSPDDSYVLFTNKKDFSLWAAPTQ
jgi:hypothetical protein